MHPLDRRGSYEKTVTRIFSIDSCSTLDKFFVDILFRFLQVVSSVFGADDFENFNVSIDSLVSCIISQSGSTFWGNFSVLGKQYFPPIELSFNKNYALGLEYFLTFNSIRNVDIGCNKFYVGDKEFIIPTISYEIGDIQSYLHNVLEKHGIKIYIERDNNTFRESGFPVSMMKVNFLRIECNITTGAYINVNKVHTIHNFFLTVPPGYKIVEISLYVTYLQIAIKKIDQIQFN